LAARGTGFGAGAAAGFAATGACPKTIVACGGGSAGLGFAPVFRLPVWNIIVRPAPSSVGAAAIGAALAGAAAGFGAGGGGFATGDWPKTIVACGDGSAGLAAVGFGCAGGTAGFGAGGWFGMVAAGSRMTLNVFWHFPQRMVRPWGPIRASSTR
jgi:hypothetical protein